MQAASSVKEAALLHDILQWDVQGWKVALEFWTQRLGASPARDCLEIGSREGGLSLWLALQQHRVTCSDRRRTAETAAALHSRYAVCQFITYQDIDATAIPFEQQFDVVVFKSVLGAIARTSGRDGQARAVREMHKALRPGGLLLFAENASASRLHRWLRGRFAEWAREWRYVSRAEMREFLRPFRSFELRTAGVLGALGATEWQRGILASIDRAALNRLVPERLHYIIYGVAIR